MVSIWGILTNIGTGLALVSSHTSMSQHMPTSRCISINFIMPCVEFYHL